MVARKLTALTVTGSLKAGDSIYAVIDGNSRRVLYDSVNSTLALTYVSSASLATKQDSFTLASYATSAQIAGDYPSSAAIAATYATSAAVATGLLTKQDSFNLATYVTSAVIAATYATSAALATGLLTKQASFNLGSYQTSAQIAAAYQNSAAVATALLTKQNSFTLSDYVTSANVAGTYTTSLYVAATYATSQQLADAGAGSGVSSSFVADTYATSGQLATGLLTKQASFDLGAYQTSAQIAAVYPNSTAVAATYATSTQLASGLLTKQASFNLTLYVTSANVADIYATSAQLALRPTSAQVAATYATSAQLRTGLLTKQDSFTLSDYVTSANVAGTYTTSLYVAATYATSQQLADAGAGSGVSSSYVALTYVTSATHTTGLLTKQDSFNLSAYQTSAQVSGIYPTSAAVAGTYPTSAAVAATYATSSQLADAGAGSGVSSAYVAATYVTSQTHADGLLTKQASFNLTFYSTSAQIAALYATSAQLATGLLTKQASFDLTFYQTSAQVAGIYATSSQLSLRPTSAQVAATYATSTQLADGLLTKQASFNLGFYQTSAQVAGIYATSAQLNTGLLTKQDSGVFVTSANVADVYATSAQVALRPTSAAIAATYATSAALNTGLLTKQDSGVYPNSSAVANTYVTSAWLGRIVIGSATGTVKFDTVVASGIQGFQFVIGSGYAPGFSIENTNSGGVGPLYQTIARSTQPKSGTYIGGQEFFAVSSAAAVGVTQFAGAYVRTTNIGSGTHAGRTEFYTAHSGTYAARAFLEAGFNVGSATGGDKGLGTINVASAIFINDNVVTTSLAIAATYATSAALNTGLLTKQASFDLTAYQTSAQIAGIYPTSAAVAATYPTSAAVAGFYATSAQLNTGLVARPTSAQVAGTYATSASLADGLLTKQASFNLGFYQTSAQVAVIYATSAALDTGLLTKQNSNTDLTIIGSLSPANDDVLQRKSAAWTNRTLAQFRDDFFAATLDTAALSYNSTDGWTFNRDIALTGPTARRLNFGQVGAGAPTTAGQKLTLWGGPVPSVHDYAFGVAAFTKWSNIASGALFRWYVGAIATAETGLASYRPVIDGTFALGDSTHGFNAADLSSGALIRFNNAYTIQHATDLLTFSHPITFASNAVKLDTTGNIGTWWVLAASGVQVPLTGTATETTLATITIPANAMGANGVVRVTAFWTYTSNGNTKTFRARLGGISGTVFLLGALTTQVGWRAQFEVHNRNATNAQVSGPNQGNAGGWGQNQGATITSLDTTASLDIVLTAHLANSTDTANLEYYLVEILKKA